MDLRLVVVLSLCSLVATAELHHFKLGKHNHKHRRLPHSLGNNNRNSLRHKYGLSSMASPFAVNAVSNDSTSTSTGGEESESLDNYFNLQFYILISIGGQSFNVTPDTGSSDLWVPGNNCSFCVNSCKNAAYDPGKSKTFVSNNRSFGITYGSGSVTGVVDLDTINIGHMAIQGQTFGVVDNSTMCFTFDGIMGMGFPVLSAMNAVPPFQNLITQKQVDNSVFSFYLKSDSFDGSLLILGGSNSSLYAGPLTYTPVIEPQYWKFKMDFIGFDKFHFLFCLFYCDAIMDSGTSLIAGPRLPILILNWKIGATYNSTYDLWTLDCSKIPTLPKIELHIASRKFYIRPQTYITVFSNVCVSPFMSLEGVDFWIIGDVFMRENYVEFDVGNQRLGIARAI